MFTKPVAAVILALIVLGCGGAEPKTSADAPSPRTLEQIEAAVAAGQYTAAIPGLEALAGRTPQDARLPYYLGLCWSHSGDLRKAAAYYEEALRLDAAMSEARSNLGLVQLEAGQLDAAVQSLSVYVEERPDDGSGYYNLGLALEAKGSLDAARSMYAKAAELDPKDPLPCRAQGDVARKLGKHDEAVEHYRRALSRAPGSPPLLLALAEGLVADGRADEAAANLRALERSEEATAEALASAAVLLNTAGQTEASRDLLVACTKRFPTYAAGFFLLGTTLARAGVFDQAAEAFSGFLTLEPTGQRAEVARRHLETCEARLRR